MRPRIGMIGLGEAGIAVAKGLCDARGLSVAGYDTRADDPALRERAERAGLRLVNSLADLAGTANVLVCLTGAKAAEVVARDVVAHLGPRHIFTDWNSTSPEAKRRLATIIRPSGAGFVDGAVMAAVPPSGHRVPVLLSGDAATRLRDALEGLDMRLEVIGEDVGQASAIKMYRSLLVKGLEALLLEFAAGAAAYGITHDVLTSMNGSLPDGDWNELAAYLLTRTIEHGERRAEELRQVADTITEAGLDPLLAQAGAQRLQWFVDLAPELPDGAATPYDDVLAAVRVAFARAATTSSPPTAEVLDA